MKLTQPLMPGTEKNVSEIAILIFSFVTAFSTAIILISALFVTVKKVESMLTTSSDFTCSVAKTSVK